MLKILKMNEEIKKTDLKTINKSSDFIDSFDLKNKKLSKSVLFFISSFKNIANLYKYIKKLAINSSTYDNLFFKKFYFEYSDQIEEIIETSSDKFELLSFTRKFGLGDITSILDNYYKTPEYINGVNENRYKTILVNRKNDDSSNGWINREDYFFEKKSVKGNYDISTNTKILAGNRNIAIFEKNGNSYMFIGYFHFFEEKWDHFILKKGDFISEEILSTRGVSKNKKLNIVKKYYNSTNNFNENKIEDKKVQLKNENWDSENYENLNDLIYKISEEQKKEKKDDHKKTIKNNNEFKYNMFDNNLKYNRYNNSNWSSKRTDDDIKVEIRKINENLQKLIDKSLEQRIISYLEKNNNKREIILNNERDNNIISMKKNNENKKNINNTKEDSIEFTHEKKLNDHLTVELTNNNNDEEKDKILKDIDKIYDDFNNVEKNKGIEKNADIQDVTKEISNLLSEIESGKDLKLDEKDERKSKTKINQKDILTLQKTLEIEINNLRNKSVNNKKNSNSSDDNISFEKEFDSISNLNKNLSDANLEESDEIGELLIDIIYKVNRRIIKIRKMKTFNKCQITGIKKKTLLNSYYIKPWFEATNQEKIDPDNVLILNSFHGLLFEKGFLSFDYITGNIIFSNLIPTFLNHKWSSAKININPRISDYLKYNNENFFKK